RVSKGGGKRIENGIKERCKLSRPGVFQRDTIEVAAVFRRAHCALSEASPAGLHVAHEERGGQPFARNIGNAHCGGCATQTDGFEVVPANLARGLPEGLKVTAAELRQC